MALVDPCAHAQGYLIRRGSLREERDRFEEEPR
jgi:hypothetical protein